MTPYTPSADILVILLNPASTFDERKSAILRLVAEAWGRGWDECSEETLALIEAYGAGGEDVARELQKARVS